MAKLAVIGDFNPKSRTHVATVDATALAAKQTGLDIEVTWIATDTPSLTDDVAAALAEYDGVWIAPGGPYRSLEGALNAIRHARENGLPLFGT